VDSLKEQVSVAFEDLGLEERTDYHSDSTTDRPAHKVSRARSSTHSCEILLATVVCSRVTLSVPVPQILHIVASVELGAWNGWGSGVIRQSCSCRLEFKRVCFDSCRVVDV
jgi:hypothetical protein